MKLARKEHSKAEMESNRLAFYARFRDLKKSDAIDKPHLSYTPNYQYPGEEITETRHQHELQPS